MNFPFGWVRYKEQAQNHLHLTPKVSTDLDVAHIKTIRQRHEKLSKKRQKTTQKQKQAALQYGYAHLATLQHY